MWQYSRFLSTSSCRWPTCGSSVFEDKFPILRRISFTELYPLIRPPRRLLELGKSPRNSVLPLACSKSVSGVFRDI